MPRNLPDASAFGSGTVSRRGALRLATLTVPVLAGLAIPCSRVVAAAGRQSLSLADPDGFVLGSTQPNQANTGVPTGVGLTVLNGNITLSTPGQVLENREIRGYVFVRAADVTIRNCWVRGPSTASFVTYGLIDCRSHRALRTRIERCTLSAQNTTMNWVSGVSVTSGATVTIYRCNIANTVDGIEGGDAAGTVMTILGNYIHSRSFCNNAAGHANDSWHPYWTHNDGVQIRGGSGHTIRGNNVRANIRSVFDDGIHGVPGYTNYSAGITVSPDKAPVTKTTVTQNWIEGGTAGFQMAFVQPTDMNLGTVSANRFGMNQYNYGNGSRYQIRYKRTAQIAGLSTNYFDPAAPSVPAEKKGKYFAVGFSTGIRLD